MDDLHALNKRILSHSGSANENIETILNLLSVCLGKLKFSAEELGSILEQSSARSSHENSLDVTSINREYLQFARQTARDVSAGNFDGLVVMNIDFAQSRVLSRLTNQQITEISRRSPGAVFETAAATALQVQKLHDSAVPHYSAALLAAA